MIILKSDRELGYMRDAGKVVAKIHHELAKVIKPEITTQELDIIAENIMVAEDATPSFKGYRGFPASTCISINEEVVHGIPGSRKLKNGDIVSIDVGAIIKGYHGDAARTTPVGNIDEELSRLLDVAEESLVRGIEKAVINNRVTDISHAIQNFVENNGYSVVRDYVGHGIGKDMHEDPQVPNFGKAGHGLRLHRGATLAIEPMVNMGTHEVETLADDWTVVTKDRKPSAHFEHTVAVTEDGPEVLTKL